MTLLDFLVCAQGCKISDFLDRFNVNKHAKLKLKITIVVIVHVLFKLSVILRLSLMCKFK